MRLITITLLIGSVLLAQTKGHAAAAAPATLVAPEKAAQVMTLRNVTVKNGEVSGEVVNNSKNPIRDVELQILYSWRWKNEFNPGKDDPGRADYYTIAKEIPPGQAVSFTYKPSPPLPARTDGNFETAVSVAGYTEISR
jgi:hypothetical protein